MRCSAAPSTLSTRAAPLTAPLPGTPSSPGIPEGCTRDTIILEYNDVAQLTEAFRQHGSKIAALILEPVVGNMGVVLPQPGFLEACRELCTTHGAVLIFDEVMTGFRLAHIARRGISALTLISLA